VTLSPITNQELISELKTRIEAGTLGARVVADEVRETSGSLLSNLDGKTLLFLIALSVGFTLLVGYSIKITSSQVANCNLEFDQSPPITLEN
jgi:hypothetical protein